MNPRLKWAIETAPFQPHLWSHEHGGTPLQILIEAAHYSACAALFSDVAEWSVSTFTQATPQSWVKHLQKEVNDELAPDPTDGEEQADCMILLVGLARKTGVDIYAEVARKLEINKNRTWGKPDADGVVEHVRFDPAKCRKCGGQMKPGQALQNIATAGVSDFPGSEIVTMSPGKDAELIECSKCSECGWSVTA